MQHENTSLCECGCGEPAPPAKSTHPGKGLVKGQPVRFINGHNGRINKKPLRSIAEDRGYQTPCHIWQLYCMPNGYGLEGGRLAHRNAWERANGPIPDGLWVCHRCDNPPCVNPAHLFLGTPSDNQFDCVAKGRRISGSGEEHSQARLTWAAVREIRASTARPLDLARRFDVHPNTIHGVLKRRTWQHDPLES